MKRIAAFLLLIVLLVAPLAAYLPVPAMAAILFIVAWSLIDFHHITDIIKRHKRERVILIITFLGTLIDLEKGIFLGILVSLIFYLYRTSQPSLRELVPLKSELNDPRRKFVTADAKTPTCPQMAMLRMEGSIFFGAVEHVQQQLRSVDEINPQKKHLMLFSRAVNFVDLAGAEMLAKEAERRRKIGGGLYPVGVQPGFCEMLKRGGQIDAIGPENNFKHKGEALRAVYPRFDVEICRTCSARIFQECQTTLPNGEPRNGSSPH